MPRSRRKQLVNQSTPSATLSGNSNTSPSTATSHQVRSTTLPFTLDEAEEKPLECRAKVSCIVWEEQVCQALIERRRAEGKAEVMEYEDFTAALEEDQLARTYAHGIAIARVYRDISEALLADHYLGGSFEQWWKKKLTEETRISLLYLALDGANASTGGGVEIHRLHCPDISIPDLARNEGQGFINLLRQIVQSAQTFQKQEDYYPIISKEFDEYYDIQRDSGHEGLPLKRSTRAYQTIQQHERHLFIAVFVNGFLKNMDFIPKNSVSGALLRKEKIPLPRPICRGSQIVDEKEARSSRNKVEPPRKFEDQTPTGIPGQFFSTPEDIKACNATPTDACHCCRRVAAEVPELNENGKQRKLLMCGRCFALDPPHRFYYCSIDCQKYDYKHGGHKAVCGKLFSDLALPAAGWQQPPSLPPLSLSLQYQLYTIKKEYTGSYPFAIYHVRYYIDGPAHPKGPDAAPLTWNKRCFCLATASEDDFKLFFDILLQAAKKRDDESIARWVSILYTNAKSLKPELLGDLVARCAEDWDVSVSKIKKWVNQEDARAFKDGVLDKMIEELDRPRRLRKTKSVEKPLSHHFAKAFLSQVFARARSQSAPPLHS